MSLKIKSFFAALRLKRETLIVSIKDISGRSSFISAKAQSRKDLCRISFYP